jgi:hypothetical protein
VKWLADENFDNAIIRGLLRQTPTLVPEISRQDDRTLLRFATAEGRIVMTHDVSTMVPAMLEQMRIESRCAPIVLVPDLMPVGAAIENILLLNDCAVEADWAAGVIHIPLRWQLVRGRSPNKVNSQATNPERRPRM